MVVEKKSDVWIAQSNASLIELKKDGIVKKIIESKITDEERESSLRQSEYLHKMMAYILRSHL
jgi:hypothetical protein